MYKKLKILAATCESSTMLIGQLKCNGAADWSAQVFCAACCMMTEQRLNNCRYSSAPSDRHLSTSWKTQIRTFDQQNQHFHRTRTLFKLSWFMNSEGSLTAIFSAMTDFCLSLSFSSMMTSCNWLRTLFAAYPWSIRSCTNQEELNGLEQKTDAENIHTWQKMILSCFTSINI